MDRDSIFSETGANKIGNATTYQQGFGSNI